MQMLEAERSSILQARDSGRRTTTRCCAARWRLSTSRSPCSIASRTPQPRLDDELVAPQQRTGRCEHLQDAPRVAAARTPGGCEECLRDGTPLGASAAVPACGHVGCCDSSIGKPCGRSTSGETGHPVMRSIEPGEAWRWCYVDERLG